MSSYADIWTRPSRRTTAGAVTTTVHHTTGSPVAIGEVPATNSADRPSPPEPARTGQTSADTGLDSLPLGQRPLPVQTGYTQLVKPKPADDQEGWLGVARALSHHETYRDTHFLRLSSFTTSDGVHVPPTDDGQYELKEDVLYHLNCSYYAEQFSTGDSRLRISTDPSVTRSASTTDWPLDSRYDSITYWLHVQHVPGTTKTEIVINTQPGRPDAPQTRVILPAVVKRSNKILTRQTALSGLAGVLIALPAILGTSSPLVLRVASAVVGSFLLAFVTYVIRRTGAR